MTAADMLPILKAWAAKITEAESTIERVIRPLKLTPESPLYSTLWGLMDAYTDATAARVGDTDEWLAWYHADNAMGASGHPCKPGHTHVSRKVRTLKGLARLIEESRTS